jgi:hypothetical protein
VPLFLLMDHTSISRLDFRSLWKKYYTKFEGKKKLSLLKEIEKVTADIFKTDPAFQPDRDILGTDEGSRKKILNAISQNFEGITELSEEFYAVVHIAQKRQELARQFVRYALAAMDSGFSEFDRTLIEHSAIISTAYDEYYPVWLRAVNNPLLVEDLKKANEQKELDQKLYNNYTIIFRQDGKWVDAPLATFFPTHIPHIAELIKNCAHALRQVPNKTTEQELYVKYFEKYSECLTETNKEKLDPQWEELDRIWMDIKYPIQVVHDIEYGYGEPLRCKVIPDFSLRFMDEEYADANRRIEEIKHVMVAYFSKRDKELAKKGLFALNNSMAAIYYIPFLCGISIHFRYSGQSIPNRSQVKNEKGVKIYFDVVSTARRGEQAKQLMAKVFADQSLGSRLNAVETIIYHVAAHEFGHAIYGLDHVAKCIKVETKTLLEEPRAELTALTTMKLLLEANKIDKTKLQQQLGSYAIAELRRFAMFDSTSLRPYIISAMSCYKHFERLGYIKIVNDRLIMNDEKALAVLEFAQKLFETILDAEDRLDGQQLETILKEMQEETHIVRWLVSKLFAGTKPK